MTVIRGAAARALVARTRHVQHQTASSRGARGSTISLTSGGEARPPASSYVLWRVVRRHAPAAAPAAAPASVTHAVRREIAALLESWHGDDAPALSRRAADLAQTLLDAGGPGLLQVTGTSTALLAELVCDRDRTTTTRRRPDGADRHGTYRTLGERRSRTVVWAGFDLPAPQHATHGPGQQPEDVWT